VRVRNQQQQQVATTASPQQQGTADDPRDDAYNTQMAKQMGWSNPFQVS
jgi:hypothetical protein